MSLLWFVTGGGWSDEGSVEQQSRIIRHNANAYWHIADEKGNVVIYTLSTEDCFSGRNRQMT